MLKDYEEGKGTITVLQDNIKDRENAYNELIAQYEIARNTTCTIIRVINEKELRLLKKSFLKNIKTK